jgi:predicted dehydrogenase
VEPINVACVGTGYWGKNLVRSFSGLPNARLHTCCDLDKDRLDAIRKQYPGVATTERYEDVLADPSIDAVVLASPAPAHYEMASMALSAAKHVYVEKPITLRSSDAEALVAQAESANKVLMVGHLFEYHPAVNKLKALAGAGDLGRIHYLYLQRLNLGIIRKDENALWSLAPHDISIGLYLLNEDPVSVSATGQAYLQNGIEDVVFCVLQFPSGAMVHIHVSWLDPNKTRRVTVVGSEKMAVFDDMQPAEKVWIYDKGVEGGEFSSYGEWLTIRSGDITIPRIDASEPLKVECNHFIECVRDGSTPRSDGRDGLRVVRVLEAAERSLKRNGSPESLA